jgi:hypothetical protein
VSLTSEKASDVLQSLPVHTPSCCGRLTGQRSREPSGGGLRGSTVLVSPASLTFAEGESFRMRVGTGRSPHRAMKIGFHEGIAARISMRNCQAWKGLQYLPNENSARRNSENDYPVKPPWNPLDSASQKPVPVRVCAFRRQAPRPPAYIPRFLPSSGSRPSVPLAQGCRTGFREATLTHSHGSASLRGAPV